MNRGVCVRVGGGRVCVSVSRVFFCLFVFFCLSIVFFYFEAVYKCAEKDESLSSIDVSYTLPRKISTYSGLCDRVNPGLLFEAHALALRTHALLKVSPGMISITQVRMVIRNRPNGAV